MAGGGQAVARVGVPAAGGQQPERVVRQSVFWEVVSSAAWQRLAVGRRCSSGQEFRHLQTKIRMGFVKRSVPRPGRDDLLGCAGHEDVHHGKSYLSFKFSATRNGMAVTGSPTGTPILHVSAFMFGCSVNWQALLPCRPRLSVSPLCLSAARSSTPARRWCSRTLLCSSLVASSQPAHRAPSWTLTFFWTGQSWTCRSIATNLPARVMSNALVTVPLTMCSGLRGPTRYDATA